MLFRSFQVAEEMRTALPAVIGELPLIKLWAFKYDHQLQGIDAHADAARVNVNFWITPDEANLDPESGGLVVYDVPSPRSWRFHDYNQSPGKIYEFLAQHKAQSRVVPHRCNRAVLFNSDLFHQTDTIRFRPGFTNRRVNITYLFGRGLRD